MRECVLLPPPAQSAGGCGEMGDARVQLLDGWKGYCAGRRCSMLVSRLAA
jgi:hypothetical protein